MAPEQWQEKIVELKSLYVLKYPKIIQSLFYMLKYQERDHICERGTNKLEWKKAKMFINNDLFLRMADFWPPGAKEENYREYEKLKFVQTALAGIQEDQVDDYSTALGKVLRWIHMAIELRTEDVKQRRAAKAVQEQERKEAQEKEKERMDKRTAAYDEAKAAYDEKLAAKVAEAQENEQELADEDKMEFDSDEWYANFDDENPPIDIPDEVEPDVDNDFNITIEDS